MDNTEEFLYEARDAFVDAQIELGDEIFYALKDTSNNGSIINGEQPDDPQLSVKEMVIIHLHWISIAYTCEC